MTHDFPEWEDPHGSSIEIPLERILKAFNPAASTSWGAASSLAGFQVSTTGRFWVSTETACCGLVHMDRDPAGRPRRTV